MAVLVAGIFTASPVCGFRPIRGARLRRSNVPNPESDTFWPFATVSLIEAMAASRTLATEALAMSVRLATSETSPRLFTMESVYVGEARTGCATKWQAVGRGVTVARPALDRLVLVRIQATQRSYGPFV